MAVSKEPILKKCKSLDISPVVMGISKESKRNVKTNRRRKVSEYGLQLKEKQKLKFIYGVLEKQFYHLFQLAEKAEGQAGENLLTFLESRFDNVVFRLGMSLTRREARQLVSHGHFLINGKKVNIPSYRIKVGDVISIDESSIKSPKFKEIIETTKGRVIPLWLELDREKMSAKVVRLPNKSDIDYEVEEHLIVELYSK